MCSNKFSELVVEYNVLIILHKINKIKFCEGYEKADSNGKNKSSVNRISVRSSLFKFSNLKICT